MSTDSYLNPCPTNFLAVGTLSIMDIHYHLNSQSLPQTPETVFQGADG
jgi:hypothetical protein